MGPHLLRRSLPASSLQSPGLLWLRRGPLCPPLIDTGQQRAKVPTSRLTGPRARLPHCGQRPLGSKALADLRQEGQFQKYSLYKNTAFFFFSARFPCFIRLRHLSSLPGIGLWSVVPRPRADAPGRQGQVLFSTVTSAPRTAPGT